MGSEQMHFAPLRCPKTLPEPGEQGANRSLNRRSDSKADPSGWERQHFTKNIEPRLLNAELPQTCIGLLEVDYRSVTMTGRAALRCRW